MYCVFSDEVRRKSKWIKQYIAGYKRVDEKIVPIFTEDAPADIEERYELLRRLIRLESGDMYTDYENGIQEK